MSVYVDELFDTHPYQSTGVKPWRYGQACHMWADTEQELHAMAWRLGLKRMWFQQHKTLPHYDLTAKRRIAALKAGALPASSKEYIRKLRALKNEGLS